MNEQSQTALDLQIVNLGDAKTLTMGFPDVIYAEEDLSVPGRLEP